MGANMTGILNYMDGVRSRRLRTHKPPLYACPESILLYPRYAPIPLFNTTTWRAVGSVNQVPTLFECGFYEE